MVAEVTPHIGYLHRCAEKIGENLTPRQFVPYTDRLDYLAGMNMKLGWSLCVEKLLGFKVSEKARHLRLIMRVEPHRQPPGRPAGATGSIWAASRRSSGPFASARRFLICSRRSAGLGSPTAISRSAA